MSALDQLRSLNQDDDNETKLAKTRDAIRHRISVLSDFAWERRVKWEMVLRWADNFDGRTSLSKDEEQFQALYLLSQFLYFGSREIRVLLQAIYRDLYLIPLVQEMRTSLGGSRDGVTLRLAVEQALTRTRFLGVGNPSESGVHLLYFFRQENGLSKTHFLDSAQILERHNGTIRLRHPAVDRYVFVDDVCGSGETATRYSRDFLGEVVALNPDAKLFYFAMFGTADGMDVVRQHTLFGSNALAVYELDNTYKCLSQDSRYLKVVPFGVSPDLVRQVARFYGQLIMPAHPHGYQNSELLLGFHHNTPDNTIPIIWADQTNGSPIPWTPAFRRYQKI